MRLPSPNFDDTSACEATTVGPRHNDSAGRHCPAIFTSYVFICTSRLPGAVNSRCNQVTMIAVATSNLCFYSSPLLLPRRGRPRAEVGETGRDVEGY